MKKILYPLGLVAALCLGAVLGTIFITTDLDSDTSDASADTSKEPRHYSIDNTYFRQVHSKETGQTHELIISLPPGYESSPDKSYPVLYYVDAYWDTPLLSSLYGALIYDNRAPEFIMVGFSYPGDNVNYGLERRRDLTPTDEGPDDGDSGGAPAFLAFIKESVVPLIETSYRVDPSQRALSGSSLGGLFTLYAMYEDPAFFDRYIAISPAASWDGGYLSRRDEEYAKTHKSLNARLFLSHGTGEYAPFREPIAQLQAQIAGRNYEGLALRNYQMQNLRHGSVKAEGYIHGLIWAWQDIAPTGPSGLEMEYRQDYPEAE